MSSQYLVVKTTLAGKVISSAHGGRCRLQTCSCRVRMHPLAHNPLQTHTSTPRPDTDERQRIGSYRVRAAVCDAGLAKLPYGDDSSHGEKCLDEWPRDIHERVL